MFIDLGPLLTTLVLAAAASPVVVLIARSAKRPWISGVYVTLVFAYSLYVAASSLSEGLVVTVKASEQFSSILMIDQLSLYLSLIVLMVALLSAIYSFAYQKERQAEFFALLLTLVVGMVGVFSAGDFVTFFVFWELMSVSSYLLVGFNYKNWEAIEASLKYLIMSSTGTAAILFGMSLLYGITGSLGFEELAVTLSRPEMSGSTWSIAAMVFVVGGLGVNVAMAPFHSWLPDAHPAAPSPISAMLSGVVIKTGIFAMFRFFTLFFPNTIYGWQAALLLLALLTMTIGNLLAAMQEDIKRLLAFSSIANIGYIVFAISIGTELAYTGGLLHVLNHAVSKSLLFLAAGSFIHAVGARELSQLSGIARRMPVSGVAYAIGAFSLAGIPGLNSFVSEYTILFAAFSSGFYVFAGIMLLNVLIGAMYHMRVVQTIFTKPETEVSSKAHEANALMLAPLVILSALSVVIGVYASPFLETARSVAVTLLK